MNARPRIVVLDGYTLNPGDLSWDEISKLGELTVHDRTPIDQVVPRSSGATIVVTNKTPITAQTIAQLPDLKLISVLATGTNIVDLPAARAAGVSVCNVPGYSTDSVAQHVFALLLELNNRVGDHDRAVHAGQWSSCADFAFTLSPIRELAGKTLGIVGLGTIGKRTAMIGAALGMKIAASHQRSMATTHIPGVEVRWLPVDDLLAESDVVSLHCPLTDATKNLISAARLSKMKKSALLINTARGPLVDEAALADALHCNVIAGAGLDVLSAEPPPATNPLLAAPRCVITPHNAWATVEARTRNMAITTNNLRSFLAGSPVNVVN